jgi:hypothetical protein
MRGLANQGTLKNDFLPFVPRILPFQINETSNMIKSWRDLLRLCGVQLLFFVSGFYPVFDRLQNGIEAYFLLWRAIFLMRNTVYLW